MSQFFTYEKYANPFADQIAQTMQRAGQIRADEAVQIGQAQAKAQEQSGQAWGQAAQGIGADASNAITTANDPKVQLAKQQIQANKTALAVTQKANQIQSGMMVANPDGTQTIDRQKLVAAFTAANIPVEEQSKRLKALDDADDSIAKNQQSKIDHLADLADSVIKGGNDENALAGGLALGKANGSITDQQMQFLQAQLAQGRSIPDLMAQVRASSQKYKDADKPVILPGAPREGAGASTLITPEGKVIATGAAATAAPKTPTEASLAADAANPQSPTQAQSKAAIDLLKPKPNATAEQDDQRYRNLTAAKALGQPVSPEDAAWAQGYEKQKTLGPTTAADAAAARQASAQVQQNKMEADRQLFAKQQAGRAELTTKVEQPLLDATEKANTLRGVVTAAKNGNVVAGSLQPLLATLGVTTMEGVKRINSTEIQSVTGAGSLLDSIKGRIGKLAEGQPMDAKLQGDLVDLANILERGAYEKYYDAQKSTTQRYGLNDEKRIQPPDLGGAPVRGQQRTVNGKTIEWDGKGWLQVGQ